MKFLTGYKTYITAFLGVALYWLSYIGLITPDMVPVDPATLSDALNATWAGLAAIFIRKGVKTDAGK